MKHRGKTLPFRGPNGEVVPGSIAEIEYLPLGGRDQWVMMRGESTDNPPLVFLHGGPGLTETQFFRRFNAPLEKSFTVVYWEQRGAGKSFDRKIPRSSMTVERFVSDLDELVDAVCKRLGKTKVVIFGHSWGSALGVLYSARFPDKVSAYVGSGQVGDWAAGESALYEFVLAEMRRRDNRRAVRKLRKIGPPPHSGKRVLAERLLLSRLEAQTEGRSFWTAGRILFGAEESSIFDLPNMLRGLRFSLDTMWDEVSHMNLAKLAPSLRVPVFFFLGRNDHWVSPRTSVAYFDALDAPSKRLVWFDHSGHEPFIDESTKFNAAMLELVHPIAAAGVSVRAA